MILSLLCMLLHFHQSLWHSSIQPTSYICTLGPAQGSNHHPSKGTMPLVEGFFSLLFFSTSFLTELKNSRSRLQAMHQNYKLRKIERQPHRCLVGAIPLSSHWLHSILQSDGASQILEQNINCSPKIRLQF